MPEDITTQILNQNAESIQKLFDRSTRIDERVKAIQENQKEFDTDIDVINKIQSEIMQKVAVLDSKDVGLIECQNQLKKDIHELEKRLFEMESSSGQIRDRWNKMFTFIIQIIWVILAAWLLMKLGLQAPAVP